MGLPNEYREVCRLCEEGRIGDARELLLSLQERNQEETLRTLIANDLGVLSALEGKFGEAETHLRQVLSKNPECSPAALNLAFLNGIGSRLQNKSESKPPVRVAIVSFLFNWPSTGGGIVHTVELARFLAQDGYAVKHFYVRNLAWGIGRVEPTLPYPSEALEFDSGSWSIEAIQDAVRKAVTRFHPDHVIITDSWNTKPLLAEAVRPYPYILRLQAMECLCPLNNVRLLLESNGRFRQCAFHQFATPDQCDSCLVEHSHESGALHQAERSLSEVGTRHYREALFRAFREAEVVLVVNPLTQAMISPYAKDVRVVTAGMDPARFPWPWPEGTGDRQTGPVRLFFAGVAGEAMKGFHVLDEACRRLCERRKDFQLVATFDPPGRRNEYTQQVGWLSQDELPKQLHDADILVMPTIAQEALGRTAVEAMAAGRPVIASRIGGLPFTVVDGTTGLLCEPGDPADLAQKIEILLDDPGLRQAMGHAGRQRFEQHYSWDVIIERHYRPLLQPRAHTNSSRKLYKPCINSKVDHQHLLDQVRAFFGLERQAVGEMFKTYREFHKAKGYEKELGELKTLCFEEAFILYIYCALRKPQTIAEVGTFQGKCTRRILDLTRLLGLDTRVVTFDSENAVRFFKPTEAELELGELNGRVCPRLEEISPDLILLDCHRHSLIRDLIDRTLAKSQGWTLAIHDCAPGLCNPRMAISPEEEQVTSLTGVWERHVLAEAFGIAAPLDPRLDDCESTHHRLRIFGTPHGLALLMAKDVRTVEEPSKLLAENTPRRAGARQKDGLHVFRSIP